MRLPKLRNLKDLNPLRDTNRNQKINFCKHLIQWAIVAMLAVYSIKGVAPATVLLAIFLSLGIFAHAFPRFMLWPVMGLREADKFLRKATAEKFHTEKSFEWLELELKESPLDSIILFGLYCYTAYMGSLIFALGFVYALYVNYSQSKDVRMALDIKMEKASHKAKLVELSGE